MGFQDSKADVKHRYTKTQAFYLSRKGQLPPEVDIFGMNTQTDDYEDEDGLFAVSDSPVQEEEVPEAEETEEFDVIDNDEDDEINDLFG